ncbi:hypothetical protein GFS24_14220 [Chitinophaga sp. SYP-B3965]|uniref:LVIVD repeat-containing protein n=1 Tax=Chitinophaga sp. SYP-B3965 TaxID=2663120 RepID=UPI001299E37A|nr:hypothetical protein [Chitinophaga sp. SYP-B3965]MRG46274.1 hypothetical protein [Chitinophaga sp. SYP-B3965]
MRTMLFKFPVIIAGLLAFGGCVKEKCSRITTKTIYTPILMAEADYWASVKTEAPQEIGQPGKIYVKDQFIYVNEPYKGVHIIDNSNPRSPKNVAFLNIRGNVDIAIKGNTLYADSYADLAVFNISDPLHIAFSKKLDGVVNYPVNAAGLMMGQSVRNNDSMVVGYNTRDTTYPCDCEDKEGLIMYDNMGYKLNSASYSATAQAGGGTGKGGSMARFTIAKDYLYTVNWNALKAFDVSDAANPVHKGEQNVGIGGIETIFPYGEYLFIGSTTAMYIYDIINPAAPQRRSSVTHFKACDPVVVEGTKAYVTVRSGSNCGGNINELMVFDISNVDQPVKLASYQMKNPFGLGVSNGRLFICEGTFGLRFMQGTDVTKISTTKLIEGINTYDVIPYDNNQHLLVSAADGVYQYDYTAMNNPVLLSKINVKNRP